MKRAVPRYGKELAEGNYRNNGKNRPQSRINLTAEKFTPQGKLRLVASNFRLKRDKEKGQPCGCPFIMQLNFCAVGEFEAENVCASKHGCYLLQLLLRKCLPFVLLIKV